MTDIVDRLLNEGEQALLMFAQSVNDAVAEIERLRTALHRISLASQDSGTTKESLGKEARDALGGER